MTFEGGSLTYHELDEAANRLAHLLAGQGVGPGQCVALLVERSAEAVVAILAVLKFPGAAYLPMDPVVPAARMQFIVEDAAPVAAITTTGLADRLDGFDVVVIDVTDPRIDSPTPHRTTGAGPRRYRLPHLPLGRPPVCPRGWKDHPPERDPAAGVVGMPVCRPAGVWPLCHSLAFDVSVWEIFGALLRGGRLVVLPESVAGSPEDFHEALVAEQVSVLTQTRRRWRCCRLRVWSRRRWR